MSIRVGGLCAWLVLSGCQPVESPLECPTTQPPYCRPEYRPVCAMTGFWSTQTYGNPCQACATAGVSGYRIGVCEGAG